MVDDISAGLYKKNLLITEVSLYVYTVIAALWIARDFLYAQ